MANWNWTSQSGRVKDTISNIMSLDDVTFDRVMKRCCDTKRPVLVLKQILGSWSKVVAKKRKSGADLTDQVRGCYTGKDYLDASAKEEEIVAVMKELHDLEFKDVCVRCFEKGRPTDFLKSVDNHWVELTRDVRKKPTAPPPPESLVKPKTEVPDPDIEIIDLSPSSSPGLGNRIAPSRSLSPSSRRKTTPVRIAPRRPSASPPPKRRTAPRRNSSPPPAKQKKPDEQEKKRYSNQLFHEKLALTAEGIWTSDMEINWMVMEIEENKLTKEFEELGHRLSEFPEQHPKYAEEWKQFWENKAADVEETGGDAEEYDYIPEWKEYWARRMEALLRLDFNSKLDEIRRKYGMDLDSLNRLRMKKLGCHIIPTNDIQQDEQINVEPLHGGKSTWRMASSTNELHEEPMSTQTYIPEDVESDGLAGCDLVQILRRMIILETQLSFLAPKVLYYFEMAEQMELSGRGNSNVLLVNEEFLDLLHKCRYRFQALIQANVLPIDVLGFMKHSVKSLGKILESPKCQAVLPNPRQSRKTQRSPSPTPMMNPMNPFSELRRRESETSRRPNIFAESIPIPEPPPILPAGAAQKHPYNTATESGRAELSEAIIKRMEHLSENQKLRIVDIMTDTLVREGRERINDQDLVEFVMGSVDPLIQSTERHRTPPRSRPSSPFDFGSILRAPRNHTNEEHQLEWIPPTRQLSPHWRNNQMYSEELDAVPQQWTGDLEHGTTRSIGIAIPPLPLSYAKATAATPPPRSANDYQPVTRRRGTFGEKKPAMKPRISDQFAKPGCYSEWPDDILNSAGSDENGYTRRPRRPGQSDEEITLY